MTSHIFWNILYFDFHTYLMQCFLCNKSYFWGLIIYFLRLWRHLGTTLNFKCFIRQSLSDRRISPWVIGWTGRSDRWRTFSAPERRHGQRHPGVDARRHQVAKRRDINSSVKNDVDKNSSVEQLRSQTFRSTDAKKCECRTNFVDRKWKRDCRKF